MPASKRGTPQFLGLSRVLEEKTLNDRKSEATIRLFCSWRREFAVFSRGARGLQPIEIRVLVPKSGQTDENTVLRSPSFHPADSQDRLAPSTTRANPGRCRNGTGPTSFGRRLRAVRYRCGRREACG